MYYKNIMLYSQEKKLLQCSLSTQSNKYFVAVVLYRGNVGEKNIFTFHRLQSAIGKFSNFHNY